MLIRHLNFFTWNTPFGISNAPVYKRDSSAEIKKKRDKAFLKQFLKNEWEREREGKKKKKKSWLVMPL